MQQPIPAVIYTGETINTTLDERVDNYPASDGWTLRLALNPRAGGSVITLDTTASGDDHLLQVSAATTGAWAAGTYGWQLWAIKDAEQYFTGIEGAVEIKAGLLSAAAGADIRTQAQRALDDAKAALAAWTPTTKSYTINGRSMTFSDFADVEAAVRYWQARVIDEQEAARRAADLPSRRKVHVRMARA